MILHASKGDPAKITSDLLILGVWSGQKKLAKTVAAIDKELGGIVANLIADHGFEGKFKETLLVQTHGAHLAKKILLIGLGKITELRSNTLREVAAVAAKKAGEVKAKKIVLSIHDEIPGNKLKTIEVAKAMAEGLLLGTYKFNAYHGEKAKEEARKSAVEEVMIVDSKASEVRQLQVGLKVGERDAKAVIMARDLVNTPASDMTPQHLVDVAKDIQKKSKKISLEVFDAKEMAKRGMGGVLAIAKGSDEPPFFIHLSYKPVKNPKKKIFIVGKGITFDSGGLSLKPAKYMENMQMDMAGGADVLALFSIIEELGLKAEVHGVVPTTENMPSGKAVKIGDVARAMNGKTIEILNTDAEGRVILADGLSFATAAKADVVIDLATLTGSCVEALGEEVAGMFSPQPKLAAALKSAADEVGEYIWEMPLVKEYASQIKSKVADVKNNASGHGAGSITAALFLKEFVDVPAWAHLDIAGPAWAEKETFAHVPLGGTGFGVRTLVNWLQNWG
jgi:leucyl aminopeptidase